MVVNIILILMFLAGIVWYTVRGFMFGWTVDRVVWLCIGTLGILGRLESIRKERQMAAGKTKAADKGS
jgi:hypothetical protein